LNIREEIIYFIEGHQEEAIEFLRKMVQFDSSSIDQGVDGKEGDIQIWLNKKLNEFGLETHLFEPENEKIMQYNDFNPGHNYEGRPNLVGLLKGSGEGKSIILNGHVDTVSAGDVNKWEHYPWEGKIVDNKMYGRGTTDMKAGTSAMIMAVKFLKDLGIELKGDVMIQSVVDEEGGGNGTLACVAEGYHADAAIVTEPTNLEIQPIGRGVLLLEVEVTGRATHAAFKWDGINAIEKAIKIVQGLNELERDWLAKKYNPLLPSPTINIGYLKGGIEAPIVPDNCIIKIDVKYLPVENKDGEKIIVTGEMVKKEVEKYIQNICMADDWLRENPPKIKWYLHVMPHNLDLDHEIITTVKNVKQELFGSSTISGLRSGSDARHLLNSGGIPTIVFGPGKMKDAHSLNESINLDDYIDSIKALALTVLDWTNRKK
jgi:acetylornithine deacetylase